MSWQLSKFHVGWKCRNVSVYREGLELLWKYRHPLGPPIDPTSKFFNKCFFCKKDVPESLDLYEFELNGTWNELEVEL